jgi:D-threo-aldose 1-dehydrogenase
VAAAAMRFPLRHKAISSVVVGCHTAEQVRHDAELFAAPIPDGLWAELSTDS